MKTQLEVKVLVGWLLIVLVAGPVVPVQAALVTAPLAAGGGSPVIPLLGIVGSWFRRNRTYRNSEAFISYLNGYYDQQMANLDQQLASGTIYTGQGGDDKEAQKAAYVVVKAHLQQDRDVGQAFAESIKKGARQDFHQAVKDAIVNVVMSTGFVQEVLGSVIKGFGQAQKIVDGALNELQGSGDIATQILGLKNVAGQLQLVGTLIGGDTGADLNTNIQGILDQINSQVSMATDDLNKIKTNLGAMQTQVQGLMNLGYIPASSEVTDALAMQLLGLGQGTPATQAILNILGVRTGTSRQAIYERGMQLIEAGDNARCRKIISDLLAALHELDDGTADEDTSTSTDEKCTEITSDELKAASPTNPSVKKPSSGKFLPFTAQDCAAPGLPAPHTAEVYPNGNGIYCEYDRPAGGIVFLSLNYGKDTALMKNAYQTYRKTVADELASGVNKVQELFNEPDRLTDISVAPNEDNPNPDVGMKDAEFYNNHFVIYITSSLLNINPEEAKTLDQNLVTYAEDTGDKHAQGKWLGCVPRRGDRRAGAGVVPDREIKILQVRNLEHGVHFLEGTGIGGRHQPKSVD
jgi:hypothetical protein